MKKLYENLKKYPVVLLFFAFILGFSLLDAIWPKRERSELENRSLAQYPAITAKGILTNQWMVNYEKYVKDQFAFRDNWIDMKSRSENMLLKTENNDILLGKDHYLFKKSFAINEKRLETNLSALEKCVARHPGKFDIMIVPSAATVLPQLLPAWVPLSDENEFLDKISARLSQNAAIYDLRDVFAAHSDEYIYYRTDHHWTATGAFYAYQNYVQTKGAPAFDLNSSAAVEVKNFYGTHYSKARNVNVVPDTITYYDLPNEMTVFADGKEIPGSMYDKAKFETRDKYAAFLRGNNGYSEIKGNGKGSILVVKDSYANSFVPYLTADYEKIGVVDYRMNLDKIDTILEKGGYDRVLFLYSFDAFSEDMYFASRIANASM